MLGRGGRAVALYSIGRYVASLGWHVLNFDIALHTRGRVAVATVRLGRRDRGGCRAAAGRVAVLATYVESELGVLVAWLIGRNCGTGGPGGRN